MTTIIVRHKVQDFDTWKRGYDEADGLRIEHGIVYASIHRDASDPDTVFAVHRFQDAGSAKAFLDAVPPAMEKAGVVGKPEVWMGEDLEVRNY